MNKEKLPSKDEPEFNRESQTYFVFNQEALLVPSNLKEGYPILANYLTNQRLWHNCLKQYRKNHDPALFIDHSQNTAFTLNPYSWQTELEFSPDQIPPPERTSEILLISLCLQGFSFPKALEKFCEKICYTLQEVFYFTFQSAAGNLKSSEFLKANLEEINWENGPARKTSKHKQTARVKSRWYEAIRHD